MSAAPSSTFQSRYEMLVKIASGGMATVFVGRARGVLDIGQLVAIKRPHPHLIEDDSFKRMLLAEANLASRIQHDNVVSVRDVEVQDDSLHLVMDYVEGLSLAELLTLSTKLVSRDDLARVSLRILLDACAGLHAAHELTDSEGNPLGLVHRDVSPHNILVGVDGIGRVVDFGIAKCVHQRDGMTTTVGTVKGKTAYMAPEYMGGRAIDRRSDVFAMGILLWESLAGKRLFRGQNDAETISRVLTHTPAPISTVAPFCGTRFDTVVGRALAKEPSFRHPTMLELAEALATAARGTELVARHFEVARLLEEVAGDRLASRRSRVRAILERDAKERADDDDDAMGSTAPLVLKTDVGERDSMTQALDTGPPPPTAQTFASTVPLGARAPALPIAAATLPLGTERPIPAQRMSYETPSQPSDPASYRAAPPSSVSQVQASVTTDLSSAMPSMERRRRPLLAVSLALLAIVVVGVGFTYATRTSPKPATPAPASTPSAETAAAPSSAAPAIASVSVSDVRTTEPVSSGTAVKPGTRRSRGSRPSLPTAPVTPSTPATPVEPVPTAAPATASATGETPRPLPTNPYHR